MDVAAAIADPVRRDILGLLRQSPLPAGAIAERFAISRPAVSRHLRVLREAGLVAARAQGRQRVYRLEVGPLAELDAWLAPFRAGWAGRAEAGPAAGFAVGPAAGLEAGLDALETEVRRTVRDRRAAADRQVSDPQERTA